ncbi:immunoglobulin superfamily member 1-like [Malaclemys terrapin pileata]|uniref:immunoglobulin superfamily member 1-like n=1 Tax=Malaclemys terrapin pileata TaxID=2991368 RepID=UPI0023A7905D|nr:immunoglobulin superfamily member 1-like [Malaclemys terrapin pileata]
MASALIVLLLGCWLARRSGVSGEGSYPKPSISVSPGGVIPMGGNVTIRCWHQRLGLRFHLYKAGDGNYLTYTDPAGSEAEFPITSARREHGGSYTCRYSNRTVRAASSEPSDPVQIIVADPSLPRPSISLSFTSVTAPGADATIRCQGQRRDVRFFLHKAGDLNLQRQMDPAGDGAEFLIPTVGRQHGGSYSCSYRPRSEPFVSSQPSDPLQLVVAGGTDPSQPGEAPAPTHPSSPGPGGTDPTQAGAVPNPTHPGSAGPEPSYPKPNISLRPSGRVAPGGAVTIRCECRCPGARFILSKAGDPDARHVTDPAGDMAEFPIHSVSRRDAGNYSCQYSTTSDPPIWSEPSDAVELVVAELPPPGPSISVSPSGVIAPGRTITIRCQCWCEARRLFLCKGGIRIQEVDADGDGGEFTIPSARQEDGGIYSCRSRSRSEPPNWSYPSDSVRIVVAAALPGRPDFTNANIARLVLVAAVLLVLGPILAKAYYSRPRESFLLPCPPNLPTPGGGCDTGASEWPLVVGSADEGCWLAGQNGMSGELPAPGPSISVSPSGVIAVGGAVTIRCQCRCGARRLFLYKGGIEIQELDAAGDGGEFTIPSARREDGGVYMCRSRSRSESPNWSYSSDIVRIVVVELSYPKPSISLRPRGRVALGGAVTVRCQGWHQNVRFLLYKDGNPNVLQDVEPAGDLAEFPIRNVSWRDAGSYSCYYHDKWYLFIWSHPSDSVELVVAARVLLSKAGDPDARRAMDSAGDVVEFLIRRVSQGDAGSYSCQYSTKWDPPVWSEPSDPVELVVAGGTDPTQPGTAPAPTGPSSTGPGTRAGGTKSPSTPPETGGSEPRAAPVLTCTILTGVSVAADGFLLLLLLAFLCYRKSRGNALMGKQKQLDGLPLEPDPSAEGLTYTELDGQALQGKWGGPAPGPEPVLYAMINVNQGLNGHSPQGAGAPPHSVNPGGVIAVTGQGVSATRG